MAGNLTIEACGSIFAPTSRKASSNYGIGSDGRIAMYVEEKDASWCSSSGANDNRAITIEVANTKAEHPRPVSERAYAALLDLVTDICRRNGIKKLLWKGDKSLVGQVDKQNITAHRWFDAKACPGDYLYNRLSAIADEVNKRLDAISIETEDNDMDVKRFQELWLEMRNELKDNDSAAWSKDAREWSVNSGLIQGGGNDADGLPNYMWEDVLTREQMVTVLYRFAQMMGKV
jgi:hypothetical protein